jgi:hypothetical protein
VTGTCRLCGCTDDDCRRCIEKTGQPCFWWEKDLCSACVETGEAPLVLPSDLHVADLARGFKVKR